MKSRSTNPRRPSRLAALSLALVLGSCLAPGSSEKELQGTPYTPSEPPDPESIGFFLTEFDASMRAWSQKKLLVRSDVEGRILRALEREMGERAQKRQDELLYELESGPPVNRTVAAAALGFTDDPAVQGPLLSALSDSEPQVVQHALMALGMLSLPDTPLSQITYLLRSHDDGWTRNNAAYAVQRIVAAGRREDGIAETCREALIDEEPGVRAQSASVLGILVDTEALQPLGDLLYDDENLVAFASATSLARIGREDDASKGEASRMLVEAMTRVKPSKQPHFRRELTRLAGTDFEDDFDAWRKWAYNMP